MHLLPVHRASPYAGSRVGASTSVRFLMAVFRALRARSRAVGAWSFSMWGSSFCMGDLSW